MDLGRHFAVLDLHATMSCGWLLTQITMKTLSLCKCNMEPFKCTGRRCRHLNKWIICATEHVNSHRETPVIKTTNTQTVVVIVYHIEKWFLPEESVVTFSSSCFLLFSFCSHLLINPMLLFVFP